MKFLSNICFLIWAIPYFGKRIYPDIFGLEYILWASFIVLSVLLPYGFAKSISNKAEHNFSYSFLLLFMLNIFLNGISLNLLRSSTIFLEAPLQIPLIAENASLGAINNEDPQVRKAVAQYVYIEFGQPIMFKGKSGEFLIYVPTNEDKKGFSERHLTKVQSKELIGYAERQITLTIYGLGWVCASFLLIFILVFRREQCKANKKIKRDC